MRKPRRGGRRKSFNQSYSKPVNEVLGSMSFSKRTNKYYKQFAKGTLENDIEKEER